MRLDIAFSNFRWRLVRALVLLSSILLPSLSFADQDQVGCRANIDAEIANYYDHSPDGELTQIVTSDLRSKGYRIVDEDASYRGNVDYYIYVSKSVRSGYSSNFSVEVDFRFGKDRGSGRDGSIFYQESKGDVSCRRWTGLADHYKDLSDSPITGPVSDTWAVISDWSNRCEDSLGVYEFIAKRTSALVKKYLTQIPKCSAAAP